MTELVLGVVDGKAPKSSTGLLDRGLFDGSNRLLVSCDPQTRLWTMKYASGGIPTPLKQAFTSFSKLKKHAEDYFRSRNVEIKKIVD